MLHMVGRITNQGEIILNNEKKSPKAILNPKYEILTQDCALFKGDKTASNKRDRRFPPLFFFFFFFFFHIIKA
jgi:hypothetical protein